MRKRLFGAVLVTLLVYCLLGSAALAASFKDVPAGVDYAEAVNTLADIGVLTGDENGNFNPNNTITRAEFATIICRLVGVADEAKGIQQSSFSDVTASHWAVGYIAKANELGIINGNGDGTFSPEGAITYEQAIKMILASYDLSELAEQLGGYPDGYIAVAQEYAMTDGVVGQKGLQITRSAVAQLLYNAMYK